jgi:DNA-binding NtrC family response regulator
VIDRSFNAYKEMRRTIQSHFNVVLQGENGIGKQHFARLIHLKRNWGGEFVVCDCEGRVKEQTRIVELLTSPAFLGKLQSTEKKDTIFIRRIDLLQAHLLAQLSDFFEELGKRGAFPRKKLLTFGLIGSLQTSTAEESMNSIQLHKFLNSLFCLRINIPPLRERKKEIPSLVQGFVALFNKEQERKVIGITPEALTILSEYNWPDNVRELKMEIERAATLTQDHQTIKPSVLSGHLRKSLSGAPSLR